MGIAINRDNTVELLAFIVSAGKELVNKAGKVADIGIKKQWLTEEDIRIERGIKNIISKMPGKHEFFAEEENDSFINSQSVWIADPISGTRLFIEGKPNYAIVVSHMAAGAIDFAIVYTPSADKLYIADKIGVSVNDTRITSIPADKKGIIFAVSSGWQDNDLGDSLRKALEQKYKVFPSQGSFAVNYCLAAEGLFDGVVSLTKDAFPEFAGVFIANRAGLQATNIYGRKNISQSDRVFVCGNENNYHDLLSITQGFTL